MSTININQIKNVPKASPRTFIIFDGTNNVWSNSASSSFLIPAGTSAQRPPSPVEGELRYNTNSNSLEFYDGTQWKFVVVDFQNAVEIRQNGVLILSSAKTLNFTGNSVNVTASGTSVNIEVSAQTTGANASKQPRILGYNNNNVQTIPVSTPINVNIALSTIQIYNSASVFQIVSSNTIQINVSGFYKITLTGTANINHSTRTTVQWYILLNNSNEVINSRSFSHHYNSSTGRNTVTRSIYTRVDTTPVTVNLASFVTNGNIAVTVDRGCSLDIERIGDL